MKSESKIQSEILELLKLRGCWIVKTIKSNRKGIPDVIACYKGLFIAVEVKKEGLGYEDATPLQKLEIKNIIKAGGKAIVTSKVEEVSKLLDNLILV